MGRVNPDYNRRCGIWSEEMDGAEDTAATAKVLGLFKLDVRSDPARLAGLTLENVRKFYLEDRDGIQLINMDNGPWRLFLMADAEVLCEADLRRLKVVEGDYDPVDRVPRHERRAPALLWKAYHVPNNCCGVMG